MVWVDEYTDRDRIMNKNTWHCISPSFFFFFLGGGGGTIALKFAKFLGAKSALAEIPLTTNGLGENRQFSLQIMFISHPFSSAIARYFPLKFTHVYLCGLRYQWLWAYCCKCNSFGDIDAITETMHAAGLMGLARCPTVCKNPHFNVASHAWDDNPQLPEHHCPLAQINYDAFVTSPHYRE